MKATIDFGTTYSGYAFSFNKDPTHVYYKRWKPHQTRKTPSTLLIMEEDKTLFGFDAERMYAKNPHSQWYLFRHFKMMLHEKKRLDLNVLLDDVTKKKLPAIKVFSLAIKFLKNDMKKLIEERHADKLIPGEDIEWYLTVPAIWNDSAKQFMRESAKEAGIASEKLSIVLEPEAASIYCMNLQIPDTMESFKPGSRYMVVDAGGGTVDIAVHEITSGRKLKQLHKPSGGAWGGTQVDKAFKQFIADLVGKTVFKRFKREYPYDYLDMMFEFETKKLCISPDEKENEIINIPVSLTQIYRNQMRKEFCDAIMHTKYADKLSLKLQFKLCIDSSIMQNFFSNPIQRIVSHVKELMADAFVKGVQSIWMVGGFSESKMLTDAMKSNIPNVKITSPEGAILAIMKGSVLFSNSPTCIAQRVCRYTYGIKTTVPFDIEKHDIKMRKEDANGPYCDKIFDKYAEVGQTVELNEPSEEKSYLPRTEDQTCVTFEIYRSEERSPMYVTDECTNIGTIKISIGDLSVPREQRLFFLSMTFGGTEIKVDAKEARTKKCIETIISFLE